MSNAEIPDIVLKRRTQMIKGRAYVYEDSPYWDAGKQQTRHKREYLGRLDDDGTFVPNKTYVAREQLKAISEQTRKEIPSSNEAKRLYHGATYLLDGIDARIGVSEDLKACFLRDYRKILSLAYYLILESDSPVYRFTKWALTHSHPQGGNLASQRISELFASITETAKMSFFERQSQRRAEKEYLAYDTTSISSYSELIRHVKNGKNKDLEPLPQVNLALVFGEKSMLPAYFRKLPGNIPDVSTIRKLLRDVQFLNLKKVKLVLDRGFYSADNLDDLYRSHYKFIVGTRCNILFVSGLLDDVRETIKDYTNYSVDQDVYCTGSMEKWPYRERNAAGQVVSTEDRRIYVHIYYNALRAEQEKAEFIRDLAVAERSLKDGTASAAQRASCKQYFVTKETPVRGMQFEQNEQAVRDHVRNFGYFILLSNEVKDPKEALGLYRNKDVIEKAFSNLKNRLDMRRTAVSSSENLEGKLFVQYVALIFVSAIHQTMKKNDLYRNYTMQTLLDELDIIERFDYDGKRLHYSEITKKQEALYAHFNQKSPNML